MNKLFTKIAAAFVGMAMAIGVGFAISGHTKTNTAKATGDPGDQVTFTYTTSSSKKLSTTYGANTLADDGGKLSISCTTAKLSGSGAIQNTYNSTFGGQQMTTNANRDTTVSFTFGSPWMGNNATYEDYTQINSVTFTAVAGSSTTYNVACTIDGVAATGDNNSFTGTKTTCTFTPADGHNSGVIVITVSYSNGSKGWYFDNLSINAEVPAGSAVQKALSSISVSGAMSKTSYKTNEVWDHTGLTVTAHYDDASTKDVTSSANWSYNPATPNSTSIVSVVATATYTENAVQKSASSTAQAVTVTDKGSSTNPYTVSEALDIIQGLGGTGSNIVNNGEVVCVTGVVSGTVETNQYGATFNIIEGSNTLKAYSISGAQGSDANSSGYVADGYTVIVSGALIDYRGTYEVGYNSPYNSSLISSIAPVSVSSIAIKTAPTKTAYKSGESFDATGLVITVSYTSGDPEDVPYAGNQASFSFSPATITAAGNVTITYRGATCTQAVTLVTVTNVTGVASAPSQVYQNGTIAASDVTLNVVYSDSSVGTVTADSVTCNTASLGTVQATATYNAATGTKTATFDVTVKKAPVYIQISDTLTNSDFDATSNTYVLTTGVSKTTDAVYSGKTNLPNATQ